MKYLEEHSHLNGREWLECHNPALIQEVYDVIEAVGSFKTKKSKEVRMKGKMHFDPTPINKEFKAQFEVKVTMNE